MFRTLALLWFPIVWPLLLDACFVQDSTSHIRGSLPYLSKASSSTSSSFTINSPTLLCLKSSPSLLLFSFPTTRSRQPHRKRVSITTTTTTIMCQLLGMNCATPTDFTFSFQGFCQRGGLTDVHSHGWGLAFYEGRGLRCFHDTQPAADSEIAKFLSRYPIQTLNMMAHIRYATQGKVDLSNVHPFQRELWGIPWTFCHNGDVPLAKERMPVLGAKRIICQQDVYHPIGETDSERIFCAMLNALRARFQTLPSLPVLYDAILELCSQVVEYDATNTIFNCLLACGPHVLWAYSWPGRRGNSQVWNGLYYIVRQPPFTTATLRDLDYTVDFQLHTTSQDRVSVIATVPLTYEDEWVEFEKGQLIVFDQGLPHMGPTSLFPIELQGRGLHSEALPKSQLEDDMRRYQYFTGSGI